MPLPPEGIIEMLRFPVPAAFARLACAALIAGASLPAAVHAEPGGCIKYGAVGAVGGHLAHHGVLGAAGGCAAGMYKRHQYRKAQREKARLYDQERQSGARATPGPDQAPDDQTGKF
jgi:hypothetical protein